ncbi:hypothetical protein EVG20_g2273 [Dentipellis fragilis]|uniref:Xylose isomerase-like TIM barrel domain-containing protein n=1 Tax=Dentipellis fragilis TaxID=205917 RepID=A0A4Y9ZBH3_9AGAM|nr:hypothetical protein EVG20_g2273 [Dentipellis fragilis]
MLQIGSSDDPSSSPDYDVIARDLRELADDAAKQNPPIKLAYEMWAWGAHVNTWEHAWEICKRVDRPNFGVCLDTFQICARAYADPMSERRILASAQEQLSRSLADLTTVFSEPAAREKIFYFQISDGSRKVSPEELKKTAEEQGIPPLHAWSNAWRPLPFMDELEDENFQGYLPIVDVVEAVSPSHRIGLTRNYDCCLQVFYEEDMARDDPEVPKRWTAAAQKAHKKLIYELEMKV